METFKSLIEVLTVASLFLAAAQIYLTVNKLWKRKHEPAVAESISIMGEFLGLIPITLLSINLLLESQWEGAVDGAMWILAGVITITIGTGRWVEGKRGRGFLSLLREALVLERSEVGDLAKSILRPSSAGRVLDILAQVALIDDHLDEAERKYIQGFADAWGLHVDWDAMTGTDATTEFSLMALRRSTSEFLATSPPPHQVEQLGDILRALVEVDEQRTDEEELVLAELEGMFNHYLEVEGQSHFSVAVVPQSEKQDQALSALLPDAGKRSVEGGEAYVVGQYYSADFADIVGDQYRNLGFFTTVIRGAVG